MDNMKDKSNLLKFVCSGIVCDNKKCDYRNDDVKFEEYKDYVNKPCPKCGENLLTQQDYEQAIALHKAVKLMNGMSEEDLELFGNLINTEEVMKVSCENDEVFDKYMNLKDVEKGYEKVTIEFSTNSGDLKIKDIKTDEQESKKKE